MLNMTDAAAGYLNRVLDESNASSDTAVRLLVAADGLRATFDTERPGDASLNHEGRTVLLLDEQASQVLSERTLDVQPTPDGPRLGLS